MIDDIATRVALTIAAFLLLATGTAVVQLSSGDTESEAANELARHLARQLDRIGTIDGELTVHGGVDVEGPFGMPPTLGGVAYHVAFHVTFVEVVGERGEGYAQLVHPLHPWPPNKDDQYPGNEESDNTVLLVASGEEFVVVRSRSPNEPSPGFVTFVGLAKR